MKQYNKRIIIHTNHILNICNVHDCLCMSFKVEYKIGNS